MCSRSHGKMLQQESRPYATEQSLNSPCMASALKFLSQSTDSLDFSELTLGKKKHVPLINQRFKIIGCFIVTCEHEPLEAGLALRQAALFLSTVRAKLGCKAKQAAVTEALNRKSAPLP